MKTELSIIVPIYNVKEYIKRCVDSILNQTFENFELILIDDGSTDNSGKICDEYTKKSQKIKVIHKENGGLSDARNAGIKESTGDYLMFIDGDDYLYNNECLRKIINTIKKSKADIIQYKMVQYYKYKEKYNYPKALKEINSNNVIKVLDELNKNSQVSISACDKIVKKELIVKNNLYFEKGLISEDIMWSLKLYLVADSISLLDDNIYVYLQQRQGSITSFKNKKTINDLYYIINYWLNYEYKNEETKKVYYNIIAYWYTILRSRFDIKDYPDNIKGEFKKIDKYIFQYDDNYKVKKVNKLRKIFGINITILVLKLYIHLKDKGIMKL